MNYRPVPQSYEKYAAIENARIEMKALLKGIIMVVSVMAGSLTSVAQQSEWVSLFNGQDLSGWDTYLGPGYDSAKGDFDGLSLGLNNDPGKVFSVVSKDGKPAIRISGERFGGISTTKEYSGYHLRVDFRWGTSKSHPKKNDKRDSGILYHAVGNHGADYGFWMRSQEFQVQEGDCGDYWGVAGGSFAVPARIPGGEKYIYDPKGKLYTFNEKSANGRRCVKSADVEKPESWNRIEIYCLGDTAIHLMNGTVVMVLYQSGQLENGIVQPLTGGKIQIQSEGAEVFYRNLEIRPITALPSPLLSDAN